MKRRIPKRRLLLAFALPVVVALGCSSDEDASTTTSTPTPSGAPWAPTTHPFDPTCAACIEIGNGALAHGGDTRVMVDTLTDDPQGQWGKCTMGFLKCLDGGGAIPACIAGAPCPDACKAAFQQELAGGSGLDAEAGAVDRVFFDEGGVCAPPPVEEVTP